MIEPRFNLMPHRQMKRDIAWRTFSRQALVTICAALLLTVTGILLINKWISNKSDFGNELADAIQKITPDYNESLSLEQQYQRMLVRQKMIEALDARRSTSVLILNDLATALPREVYLTRISEDGTSFTTEGRPVDAEAAARFFERLSLSAYLHTVRLGEIRAQESEAGTAYYFSISAKVNLVNLVAPEAAIGGTQ